MNQVYQRINIKESNKNTLKLLLIYKPGRVFLMLLSLISGVIFILYVLPFTINEFKWINPVTKTATIEKVNYKLIENNQQLNNDTLINIIYSYRIGAKNYTGIFEKHNKDINEIFSKNEFDLNYGSKVIIEVSKYDNGKSSILQSRSEQNLIITLITFFTFLWMFIAGFKVLKSSIKKGNLHYNIIMNGVITKAKHIKSKRYTESDADGGRQMYCDHSYSYEINERIYYSTFKLFEDKRVFENANVIYSNHDFEQSLVIEYLSKSIQKIIKADNII